MISIIIVNYRTPGDLCRLLDSLAENPPGGPWEAIVVDNDSRDDSVERVRAAYPHVRLIESGANTGFAGGVNQGLAEARGDFLLLLNPDIEVHAGSIDRLREFLEANPQAGLCASRLHNPDGSLQYTCRRSYTFMTILLRRTFLGKLFPDSTPIRDHLMLDYDHRTPRDVDWVAGACMMVRREALDEVGPMDERYFMYFEDVDWCTRMHRRGWGVWYVPDSVMTHGFRRASARGFSKAARFHAGSFLRFWEKWSAALYLVRRHRRGLKAGMLALTDLLAINLAFLAAYFFRQGMAHVFEKPLFPLSLYASFLVTTNIVAFSSFVMNGLYRDDRPGDWVDTMFRIGRALGITCLILLATTFVLYARAYSRLIVLSFWPLALLLMTVQRRVVYGLLETARERRLNIRRIALVGDDHWVESLTQALRKDPRHGFEPVRVPLPPAERPEALRGALEDERISDVILSTAALEDWTGSPGALARSLQAAGITVQLAGPWSEALSHGARVAEVGGRKVLRIDGREEGGPGRLFQRSVAGLLIVLYGLPALVSLVVLAVFGRRPRRDPAAGTWIADGWGQGWLRRLSLDRYPGLFRVLAGREALVAAPGEPGLFDGGRSPYDGHLDLPDGPSERALKSVVRDLADRLRGGSGPEIGHYAPLLKRSH